MVFLTSFSKKWPFVLFIPKAELDRSDNHRAVCFASYVFPLAPGEWCETWSDLAGAAISAAILTLPLKSIHCVEKGAIVTRKEIAKRAWWLAQLKDACRRTTGIYFSACCSICEIYMQYSQWQPGKQDLHWMKDYWMLFSPSSLHFRTKDTSLYNLTLALYCTHLV